MFHAKVTENRRSRIRVSSTAVAVCLAIGVASLALAKPHHHGTHVSYPNFHSTKGLKLNANAVRSGKRLRLTSEPDQIGSAFTKRSVLSPKKSFHASFQIDIHDGTQGDGMTFVIQRGSAGKVGAGGGGLGYSGINHSVAVEFDTYLNFEAHDPDANHVAVLKNGNTGNHLVVDSPSPGPYGGPRSIWADYSAKRKRLKVFYTDKAKKPKKALLSQKINLQQVLGGKARAGFTAATGGSFEIADVTGFKLKQ
ncbi:hypothetical protein BH10ACT11_BH10ACT11_10640 [soil metagenome]